MTLEVQFNDEIAFGAQITQAFAKVKSPVQFTMAQRFRDLTLANFGIAGVDRPVAWPPLTYAYAQKMKREYASLFVTGRLHDAIQVGGSEGDSTTVSVSNSSVPYATVHQYGGGNNIPARPYFPMDKQGNVMPYTFGEVVAAAQEELVRLLS